MEATYEIQEYGGKQAIFVREWSRECEEEIQRQQRPIVLNQARGWKVQPITFLAGLEVEELAVLAHVPVPGLERLPEIRNLRRLSLHCEPTMAVPLDEIPALGSCWVLWYEQLRPVFRSKSIRVLGVTDLPDRDLSGLQGLVGLEELRLKSGGATSIRGIARFRDTLRVLQLCGLRKLVEIDELQGMQALTRLSLEGCKKIGGVDALTTLTGLTALDLSDMGEIGSLSALRNLQQLQEIAFVESTNVLDGDLFFLESMPRLRRVVFQERSHYSHTSLLGLTRAIRKPWKRRK